MYTFCIEVAEVVVQINCTHITTKKYCNNYISKKIPQFIVNISEEDINTEKTMVNTNSISSNLLELTAVLRKVSTCLASLGIILMHGSALEMNGKAYLFCAPSGTGKSTHAKLWREAFGERVKIINDDKPFLKLINDVFFVYGSPWCGKEKLETNTSSPLAGIGYIVRNQNNYAIRIAKKSSFSQFYNSLFLPNDESFALKSLKTYQLLCNSVPAYMIYCNMELDAAITSYNSMNRKEST